MHIRYEPIIEVLFEHSYYADGLSADFGVAPSSATSARMRSLGLVLKTFPGGFRVFCKLDIRASTSSAFYSAVKLDTPFALQFRLTLNNTLFDNFTNLPGSKAAQQFYYLSNRVQVSGANAGNLLLGETESAGGRVGTGDLNTAAGPSAAWAFAVPPAQNNTQASWQDNTGATVLQANFAKDTLNRVRAQFDAVQLAALPDARYRVLTSPLTPAGNRIFYKDNQLAAQVPFGLVEIFSHPVHADYRFRQEENVVVNGQTENLTRLTFKTYRIRFERRSMPWQYFVVRRNSSPPVVSDLRVLYGANQSPYPNGVGFTEQAVPGQPLQRLFTSNAPLPFFQSPKLGIELRHKQGTQAIEPMVNLANPAVSAVRIDNLGNFYAESVIYI